MLNQISLRLKDLDPLSAEYDLMSTALYGSSEILNVDREGRVMLSDKIRHITGATTAVTFVGLGHKFQIWEPDQFAAVSRDAARQVFPARDGQTQPQTGQA
ncbi:MAG: hypothetical protein AAGJ94_13475 [Pseudomonadota bacterium]